MEKTAPNGQNINGVEIVSFSNHTREDKKLLKRFVDFHWKHYQDDPQYVPLLDYEYLGFKLIGIKGFFEPNNLFFKHADMRFFMAFRNGNIVGRCNAFVNRLHNEHWNDKVGFFGQFETVEDQQVADSLLKASEEWLKDQGMDTIRGPQNLPVNDATPGFLTEGFDTRPVMYYHYNKPYYADLARNAGYKPAKRVKSWEVSPSRPWEEKLVRISQKVVERYNIKVESWDQRPLPERKKEMLQIYNEAWNDNYGFVPFTEEEFSHIIDDMLLIMDKGLFIFLYINDEPAGFFGGVPNVTENLGRIGKFRRLELLRALKIILFKNRPKGFRLGYLGVKPKFRRFGLDGVMLWKQKAYARERGYEYCDMGWVLEDNAMTIRLIEMMGATPSKTYTIFEKSIG
jgi:GNAT superfamily N-acetyltransferase